MIFGLTPGLDDGMNLRKLILDRTGELGLTPWDIAKQEKATGVHQATMMRYLNGSIDTKGAAIGSVLSLLGLEVRPVDKGKTPILKLRKSATKGR
jgi:hypothetical protein